MNQFPKFCNKKYQDLIEEFKNTSLEFIPEWNFNENNNDFGTSLVKIFCEMQEDTINKLNRSVNNIYNIFLNLIEVSPMPKHPSLGLITVEASKNSKPLCIKKGSKLSANGDITFETLEDVFAIDNRLMSIFMTDYLNKKIVKPFDFKKKDESEFKKFKIFDFDQFPNLQSQILYFFDNDMFSRDNLDLNFNFKNKISFKKEEEICDFFSKSTWQCYDEKHKKWIDSDELNKKDNNTINVKFKNKTGISKILENEARYIRIIPPGYKLVDLTEISYYATSKSYSPEDIFSGEDKIVDSDFLPFKERYYIYDCFYIKCDEVLSHSNSNVIVTAEISFTKVKSESGTSVKNYKMIMSDVDFAESEPSDVKILSVNWEYWNGNTWDLLKGNDQFFSINDSKTERSFEFICPKDISRTDVGSKNGLFIRCKIMKISNQFSTFVNYVVPYLRNLKLKFDYKNPIKFKNIIVNHDLIWQKLSLLNKENEIINILEKSNNEYPALYIKLEKPISEGVFSIFFDIDEGSQKEKISFKWQYLTKHLDKQVWLDFDVIDFTENLSKSGIVKILGEKKFCQSRLFGEKGYFIRAIVLNDIHKYKYFPTINDIKFNVVSVIQKDSKPYEYFYINENEKNKICSLSSKNLFEIEVWVDETSKILPEEQKNIDPENIEIKTNKLGLPEQIWIKWYRISQISHAGPNDRCYEVNLESSQIIFGDGVHGKIPPAKFNESIRIKYSTTDGKKGNIPSHSNISFDSVFHSVVGVDNPKPMYNGLDDESIDHAASRTFDEICRGKRIVSNKSLENAILLQNKNVYKIKCFPHLDIYGKESFGDLTIVVLPKNFMKVENKFDNIKNEIELYIEKNMPFNLLKNRKIVIREVKYIEFYVNLVVIIKKVDYYQEVYNMVNSQISSFLNPITGNKNKTGYEIGKLPTERDIINSINFIPGINRIESVNIYVKTKDENGEKRDLLLNDAMKLKFAVPVFKELDLEIHI